MNLCQMVKYFHHNPAFDIEPKKDDRLLPVVFLLERETRFELATFALARQRSTTEPFPHWWEQ